MTTPMKMTIYLVAVLGSCLSIGVFSQSSVFSFLDDPGSRQEFDSYLAEHEKSYEDTVEYEMRYSVYLRNRERVLKHNQEAEAGKHSFTLALNHLADMTDDEYSNLLGYHRKQWRRSYSVMEITSEDDNAPDAWDWRDHNVVAPVKNQGSCGSCWAFSAVAAMEGLYANSTGNVIQFSEQELVDCTLGGEDSCDHGGEMHDGFEEIIIHHNGKIDKESQYPYTAQSMKKCLADDSKAIGNFTGYGNVTHGDEEALKVAVWKRPVVSIAIDASSFMFQLYHGGVFSWPYCNNTEEGLDHGVAVVGYGSESGQDYWIVKNSWGPQWGMQGYILMSRNSKNQCGVATDASYPLWGGEK